MEEQRILKTDDVVRVRREGSEDEWVPGVVMLASENGRSAMVVLNGMVPAAGGYAASLPIMVDYEKGTVKSLFGDYYEVDIAEPQEKV